MIVPADGTWIRAPSMWTFQHSSRWHESELYTSPSILCMAVIRRVIYNRLSDWPCTFGSHKYNGGQIAAAVLDAASIGYQHFDCASVYDNEREIGRSFLAMLDAGMPREDLWVTSKVWNDMHGTDDVIASCRRSIDDLRRSGFCFDRSVGSSRHHRYGRWRIVRRMPKTASQQTRGTQVVG